MESQHGVKRVLLKLEASINNGNYYEAHQMYRTLYFRYLGQKRYSDLLKLLYSGSLLFLQHEQYTSGADLGLLFIDVLKKSETEPCEKYFEKLIDLFSLMNPTSPERETFVQTSLRWSVTGSNYRTGHPSFHQKLAHVYWHDKNYSLARQHFLYTNDGLGCATMLMELLEQQGYSSEMDLFITQIVLQYLCLQNKVAANEAFKSYVGQHPKLKGGPPFIVPLLNFVHLLLKTIDSGKLSIFTILCEQYLPSLKKDPGFLPYLDKIGQLYFNVPPKQPANHGRGFFGNFLQSFFNGLEEEEERSQDQRGGASTSIFQLPELD